MTLLRTTPNPAGFLDLQVADVPSTLTGVRVIDVREPAEFTGELGHLAQAELVPLATVPAQATNWPKNETYLMVCRSGGRSGNAAQAMLRMGFTNVMNLVGGMLAWNAAQRPVAR
jgi:rhodanese-related sulfurtransferase